MKVLISLKCKIDPIKNGTSLPVSALQQACHKGKKSTVQLLLQNGADVNYVDQKSSSALHFAVSSNQADIVKLLLNAKAEG